MTNSRQGETEMCNCDCDRGEKILLPNWFVSDLLLQYNWSDSGWVQNLSDKIDMKTGKCPDGYAFGLPPTAEEDLTPGLSGFEGSLDFYILPYDEDFWELKKVESLKMEIKPEAKNSERIRRVLKDIFKDL